MTSKTTILLGVTGSIAAFRSADLVRQMITRRWDVHVLMTDGATKFVTPLTFHTLSQNPVGVSMWDANTDWMPEHIATAERADVFVIAPCTANVIAKIAHGMADDLLTCSVLVSTAPLVIAPAMNVYMWENAATQSNVDTLRARGIAIVDVETGDLACGYEGQGRLAGLEVILETVETLVNGSQA